MNMEISDFYCTNCGNKALSLPRFNGGYREPGHLKKLYCVYCQSEQNTAEIRPFGKYTKEMFDKEFKGGNFNVGVRKRPFKQFIKGEYYA